MTIRRRSARYLILAVLLSSSLGAHVVVPREPRYQNTTTSQVNRIRIDSGSGNFLTKGGPGREEKTITVFYHNPKTFTRRSPVLIVVPGAGRNAGDYRDAWVSASEKYGVLILSPEYVEKHYPEFWSYNLGGMLTNVVLNRERSTIVRFDLNRNPNDWIFSDFDRIFSEVRDHLGLERTTYDMFGHSAGGQVLHRLTLFYPQNKADRILAGNSGWYTVPTFDDVFPYGLGNSTATAEQVVKAFQANLVVLLGELDNESETRGDLVRTAEVDVQGISRLQRGRYFFQKAMETAEKMNAKFNWKLQVVPNVGHDVQRMSQAAAEYLYSNAQSR